MGGAAWAARPSGKSVTRDTGRHLMTTVDPAADLYRLLGVDPSASRADIDRAYRRLARRWHPDMTASPGAAERFARISTARRVLSDPTARARYDTDRATASAAPARSGPSRKQDRSAHESDRSPWPTGAPFDPHRPLWLGGPSFDRAFDTSTHRTTREAEAEVEVTLQETYRGAHRILTVSGSHGTSTVPFTIPPGVVSGQLLRVPVDPAPGGRAELPVVVRVRLALPEGCYVEGRTVHLDVSLSPWEGALGTTVALHAPLGEIHLPVPPGTSTGAVVTTPGRGIPNPTGPAGDLCAHVRIVVPTQLSAAERRLFAQLARTSTFRPRAARGGRPYPGASPGLAGATQDEGG